MPGSILARSSDSTRLPRGPIKLNRASRQDSLNAALSAPMKSASFSPIAAKDSDRAIFATSTMPGPTEGPKCLTPQSPAAFPPASQFSDIDFQRTTPNALPPFSRRLSMPRLWNPRHPFGVLRNEPRRRCLILASGRL